MKKVKCYLCGSDVKTALFLQEGRDPYLEIVSKNLLKVPRYWYVCDDCGYVYRSPVLEESELKKLYENYEKDVFKNSTSDDYFDKIINIPEPDSENAQKTIWLERTLIEHGLGSDLHAISVLDVGCGGGTLLYALSKKLGCTNLYGVELNQPYADLAKRRLDADIRNEKYQSGMFGKKFDLVVFTKVLEHIPEPLPFIAELARDLSTKGILFLEVPDIMDIYSLPPSHERFYIPHIYYFSANTLRELLAREGLSILTNRSITTHRGRSYLQLLAGHSSEAKPSEMPYDDPQALKRKRAGYASGIDLTK